MEVKRIVKTACAAILSAALFISSVFSLTACGKKDKNKTPFIGENGNWWIGETDTGVCAVGKDGRDGVDGKDGQNGQDGRDGTDGKAGTDAIAPQFSYDVESGYILISYDNGNTWSSLANVGAMVSDGKDGVSVSSCEINSLGELVITYSNGKQENLGVIVADAGTDGVGISDASVDTAGNLTVILTDGRVIPLGNIKGADGKDGGRGKDGKDGTDGVTPRLKIDTDSLEWCVSYDNGNTWQPLGILAAGNDGTDGTNGVDGKDGVTPRLRINGETLGWEVSYDGGKTWEGLGVVAKGESGSDGISPMLRIEQGYWQVSYNNGVDWRDTGVKAEGTDGENGKNGNDGRGIVKTEIINGYLYVTYTDSEVPVNVGKVSGTASEYAPLDVYTEALAFYPIGDGDEYGVKIGNAIYMKTIVIPETYNGKPVTTILNSGFSPSGDVDTYLESVVIPSSITKIEANAFSNCTKLKTVYVPASVELIGYMAFNAVETVRFERSEAPDGETWGTTELGCTFIEWDYKITE